MCPIPVLIRKTIMKSYLATLLLIGCSIAAQSQTLKSLAEQHKRYIGVALGPQQLADAQYAAILDREIDCLTPENAMKWKQLERTKGAPNYHDADQIVAHAQAHGMRMRGHTFLWYQEIPDFVAAITNATELRKVIADHITNEMGRFKGKIYAWDVVNEVINDGESGTLRDANVFYKLLGKSYIADAFKHAHEVDPAAKLYINDYSIESKNKKSDALYNLVKELKAEGVPVQGVGFQSHFWQGGVPHDLQATLERFAALDVDVAITELDISIANPVTPDKLQAQEKDYETVFAACLAVPRCVGVTIWGLTDKYSWIPGFTNHQRDAGLPFDADFKEKPAYTGIKTALSKH